MDLVAISPLSELFCLFGSSVFSSWWVWLEVYKCCLFSLKNTSREGNSNPLQYSCLEIPLDRGAWWVTVHRLQSQTQLSYWHTHTKLRYLMVQGYTLSTLLSPAGSRMGQAAPGRQDCSPPPSLLEVLGPQCLQKLALGK